MRVCWLSIVRLGAVCALAAVLVGCVEGAWPFATPTPSPAPPAPSPRPAVLVLAAAQPTATPIPSATPTVRAPATPTASPTPPRPTATTRPSPSATATAKPASPTPAASAPAVLAPNAPPLIVHGKPETGLVGLSFDAGGRDGGQTGSVLDTLKRLGVHATFFLTGEWAEANPALVKRMAAEGHELGNHTYDHPNLTTVPDQEIISQVARTEQSVQKVAGVTLKRYLRPPFGAFDRRMLGVLEGQGFDVIYWSLDSGDWRAEMSAADVTQRVGTKANAGDIVVFHCYPAKTAQALPPALEALKARGLNLGTVSEVLGRSGGAAREPTPASR